MRIAGRTARSVLKQLGACYIPEWITPKMGCEGAYRTYIMRYAERTDSELRWLLKRLGAEHETWCENHGGPPRGDLHELWPWELMREALEALEAWRLGDLD